MSELIPYFIIIAILLFVAIFSFRMAIITNRVKKQGKQLQQNKINELNSQLDGNFSHAVGLSLPENTNCHVYLCDDRVVIEGNGITFNLLRNKITDISMKTDKEIQKAYVSSAGGAVGGALLFGPLGALIGGRVKEKKNVKTTTYLIFTYEKEGHPDYIAFDVGLNAMKAIKFINYFRKNNYGSKKEVTL